MKKTRIVSLLLVLALCLGLLPMAAMAEESETEYDITFDANGGQFSDGTTTRVMRTQTSGVYGTDETFHLVMHPDEDPTREGYRFLCWYLVSPTENPGITGIKFTQNETVKAYWEPLPEVVLTLDPNGGTCPVKTVKLGTLGTAPTLREELPVPTREGYRFQGWYSGTRKVAVGNVFSGGETIVAKWTKLRTSKVTPSVKVIPSKIEAGVKKVELTLQYVSGNETMDWRPLERALYMGGAPSDWEAAAKSLISGNFSDVGLKVTKIFYEDFMSQLNDDAYPYEFYPEGVCPASGVTLTLEGEAKAGTLTIQLAPENFLEYIPKGDDTVLDAPSAGIFNAAQVTIPVGGGANAGGPFTVKFDLNFADKSKEKASERPKDQTVSKGGTVALPDGSKLTPPSDTHEFYAWCLPTKNEKGETQLFPWRESAAVTADMTLYAGWIRKGAVVKEGQAIDAKPAESQTPAETAPAAPKFTDVAAASPFAPAISWAVEKGITNGKTATTFGPGDPCTRAQIVTFLWRAAGSPEPKTMEAEYADVTNADAYFYKAIQWAAEMGMEESGTFKPGDPCTRGQAMYFIWKARGSVASTGSAPSFTDLSEDSTYYDAVLWAVGQGVTNGTTPTTFSPDSPCTRGQIVTFLYRAYASK